MLELFEKLQKMSTNNEFDTLLNIVQAFNGNMFGDFIRDFYVMRRMLSFDDMANKSSDTIYTTLNIILNNKRSVMYFIKLLHFNFEICKDIHPNSNNATKRPKHSHPQHSPHYPRSQHLNHESFNLVYSETDIETEDTVDITEARLTPQEEANRLINEITEQAYTDLNANVYTNIETTNNNTTDNTTTNNTTTDNTTTEDIGEVAEEDSEATEEIEINLSNQVKKILKLNIFHESILYATKEDLIYKTAFNIDSNMIATNLQSTFLINQSYIPCNSFIQERRFDYTNIFNRIMYKRFAFVSPMRSINEHLGNLVEAIRMIQDGWIMDDLHLGTASAVLLPWGNAKNNNYRLYYSKEDYNKIHDNNNCSICGSEFKDVDIIINTKCNHNFHYICSHPSGANQTELGLRQWITKYNNNCPVCRRSDFI